MRYEINLGRLAVSLGGAAPPREGQKFRIALLGDWSARAHRGDVAAGAALAERKPLRVDCDNLDATIERLGIRLRLPLSGEAGVVEVGITSMEDFHPDQLYAKLPIFSELAGVRSRLQNPKTFAAAAQEVQSWTKLPTLPATQPAMESRGSVVPAEASLIDFQRLLGRPLTEEPAAGPIQEMLQRVVAPYITPEADPRQESLVAAVDEALSATMSTVLHHPEFQAAEALWRSADFLVRRLETDVHLQIVLVDVTAEELAADLSQGDDLAATGLYQLLVEKPPLSAQEGAYTVLVGNYLFEQTPSHADLLGRLARIVAQIPAPFIAGIGASSLEREASDLPVDAQEAWAALAARPESGCLGLTVPRFLLRLPYGDRTDPIDSFDFEEWTPGADQRGLLWGNSAVLAGLLLGLTYTEQGQNLDPGSILQVGELPLYYYTDADGDQQALPCTERLLTSRVADELLDRGFMPVLAIKGAPEARLADFRSVGGGMLRGFWNLPEIAPDDVRSGGTAMAAGRESREDAVG